MWSVSYCYHYKPNEWFFISGLELGNVFELIKEKSKFGAIEFKVVKG